MNWETLREAGLTKVGSLTEGMGLAVGAVPYVVVEGGIAVGFHCKTVAAPKSVQLGRSDDAPVKRPSPLQLKRGETRGSYTGRDVNSLVAV